MCKRNILRLFGDTERMESNVFVKKVYVSESMGPNSRGRPPERWRDRVKEYMCESVGPDSRGRPPGRWRDKVKEYMCESVGPDSRGRPPG